MCLTRVTRENFTGFPREIHMLLLVGMFLHGIKNTKIFTKLGNQLILCSKPILFANVCKIFILSMALGF